MRCAKGGFSSIITPLYICFAALSSGKFIFRKDCAAFMYVYAQTKIAALRLLLDEITAFLPKMNRRLQCRTDCTAAYMRQRRSCRRSVASFPPDSIREKSTGSRHCMAAASGACMFGEYCGAFRTVFCSNRAARPGPFSLGEPLSDTRQTFHPRWRRAPSA